MGGSYEDLLVQLHKTREFNAQGAVLFDYAHLGDKYIEALTTRIFNKSYEDKDTKVNSQPKEHNHEIKDKDKEKKKKKKKN